MKNTLLLYFGAIVLMAVAILGCTPNANTYYNRQMQPIVTKYNVLFNGEEAFRIGRQELLEIYEDNYDEILSVEPIRLSGEVQLDGVGNPNFERAEEKAIKTIQLHSMVFDGVQRNYKIDDAYLLLGKARYYNERFVPALEAFNHMLTNYGKSERINEAAIWVQKTNLQLHKNDIAIENLQQILAHSKLRKKDKSEAYATLGQAYINKEEYTQAATALHKAGQYTTNKKLKGRYLFIAAQLYERLKMKDSAAVTFEKIIKLNWKIPRRMWIEALVGKTRNSNFEPQEKTQHIDYLTKLERRYEHKKFLDVLYYHHANLISNQQLLSAIQYYKKSLQNNTQNNQLKGKTHERLAELYFHRKNYVAAYHHFDSTLVYVPENTFEKLFLIRKKENLALITELEYTVRNNDSILKISKMDKEQQYVYFQRYIDSLEQITFTNNSKKTPNNAADSGMNNFSNQSISQGRFYFHNPVSIAYGKQQFQQLWGNRELVDNWRWISTTIVQTENTQTEYSKNNDTISKKLTPNFYISQLPTTNVQIKELEEQRNNALYQLGILYRNKFNDNEKAAQNLQKLIELKPNKILEPAALYQWYRNLEIINPIQAQKIKEQLITSYPNSDYAQLISGNETSQQTINQESIKFLKELEEDFLQGNIAQVAQRIKNESAIYAQTKTAPKIDLLKAKVNGRLYGVTTYIEELEYLAIKYPDTQESKLAKKIIEELKNTEKEEFIPDDKTHSWKIIIFNIPAKNNSELTKEITEELSEFSDTLLLTTDSYNNEEQWIVIHGLQDRNTANIIRKHLKKIFIKYEVQNTNIPISSENYRIVLLKKSKDEYLQYLKNNF